MEDSSRKEHSVVSLTDDLLLEILSRCVSKSWLAFCSDPIVCKKAPQTLSGFFYQSYTELTFNPSGLYHHFTNLLGRGQPMVDPSLNFLFSANYVEESSVCEYDHVVCNPATEKWTVLPKTEARLGRSAMYLGFDPTVSSHFTVFLLSEFTRGVQDNEVHEEDLIDDWYHQVIALEIYSSQTGRWTYHQSQWGEKSITIFNSSVFYNGALHVITLDSSVNTVDTEGKIWRTIRTPYYFRFIGMYQGHLYAVRRPRYSSELPIWVLNDYGGKEWSLKQTINSIELFGTHNIFFEDDFPPSVIAFHPECSVVFMILGYNRKVHDICILSDQSVDPYLPYIPCFSEWFSDGH
ncbi:hypothetical protein BDA96_03G198400 [Sorghum bicolor]|uniref:F-box associated beta-propeller type 3 domain-containing protein n=1 Tax=Sorghum bicolor TaxID=4558 RepID=A0A921RCU9_SORBI|nr:hypothetical protein BDA96_03G198400 [Sorghum bicolor]